jgi:S-adenosylmethionine decarboxylase
MIHIMCKMTNGIKDNFIWENALAASAIEFNLDVKGAIKHEFETPPGITAILLLGESHFSIHTFYEDNKVMVDLFSCNPNIPYKSIIILLAELTSSKIEDLIELERN